MEDIEKIEFYKQEKRKEANEVYKIERRIEALESKVDEVVKAGEESKMEAKELREFLNSRQTDLIDDGKSGLHSDVENNDKLLNRLNRVDELLAKLNKI